MSSACEVDVCGVDRHARAAAGLGDAERAARLEQQLRRRPRQGRLLPLQQPAEALLRRTCGWTTRRSSPAPSARQHLRHLRRPRQEPGPMTFARFSTDDARGRSAATWARASSPTTRSNLRRRRRRAHPEHAGAAALHLRERLRAPRGRQPLVGGRRSSTRRRRTTSGGTCTGTGRVRDGSGESDRGMAYRPWRRRRRSAPERCSDGALMAIVAGVDFGTLSVRVSIVDTGGAGSARATAEYPLHRKREDPDHATQSHAITWRRWCSRRARALDDAGRRRARRSRPSRSTPPGRASSRSARGSSRSTTTTSGATTAPGAKRR